MQNVWRLRELGSETETNDTKRKWARDRAGSAKLKRHEISGALDIVFMRGLGLVVISH
jgi:hypothetical protein